MKTVFILISIALVLIIVPLYLSEPSFNGTNPGCEGGGCHTFSDGAVSITILDSVNIEVTVSGTSSKVAGELVDNNGLVVDVVNPTNSNPFVLTAPVPGNYIVNAGYKSPGPRTWDSAAVNLIIPVELASFTASVNNNDVTLYWQTATELNNSGFDIERTNLIKDWEKIGFVLGNGTTTEIHNYTFADKDLREGNYNYRIKQIDYNGTYEYFELENTIEISPPNDFALLQNYPNPFNPATTIKFVIPEKTNVTLTVFNSIGEETTALINEEKAAGSYDVNFNAEGYTSGIYYYRLQAGAFVETKKMILLR